MHTYHIKSNLYSSLAEFGKKPYLISFVLYLSSFNYVVQFMKKMGGGIWREFYSSEQGAEISFR